MFRPTFLRRALRCRALRGFTTYSVLPGPMSSDLCARSSAVIANCESLPLFDLAIKSGDGVQLTDMDDNEYIDCLSGASVAVLGYGDPYLPELYSKTVARLAHTCHAYLPNPEAVEFAETLIETVPSSAPQKVMLGLSGSDACDAAIKAARRFTGRQGIISFVNDYHGATGLSQQASGLGLGASCYPAVAHPYFGQFVFPHDIEAAEKTLLAIQEYLTTSKHGCAAVILEPIQGDGGVIVPPDGFIRDLHSLAQQHGALVISDEVQSGMGRTGAFWAVEHDSLPECDGLPVDLVVTGKGLAAGYAAISAVVGSADVMDSMKRGEHVHSLGGHPASCAVANAVIRRIVDEGLPEQATVTGKILVDGFRRVSQQYPDIVRQVRGRGLMIGATIEGDAQAAVFGQLALHRGVLFGLFGPQQETLRVEPPIIISEEQCHRVVDVFESVAHSMHVQDSDFQRASAEAREHAHSWVGLPVSNDQSDGLRSFESEVTKGSF